MCGIAGYSLTASELAAVNRALLNSALGRSIEHRGRDATGIAFYRDGVTSHHSVKRAESATKFFAGMPEVGKGATHALIHTRNATNGVPTNPLNNHPHTWGPISLIHNGIVSNYEPVFEALNHKPYSACDSEAVAVAIAEKGPVAGMEMIQGWAAVAWFDENEPQVTWGANLDGDMYVLVTKDGSIVFGSEKATVLDPDVILAGIDGFEKDAVLYNVKSGMGFRHDRTTGQLTWWEFDEDAGRKNYPKVYVSSGKWDKDGRWAGHYGGWGDEPSYADLRAITDGTAASRFSDAIEATGTDGSEEQVHGFNDDAGSRLPFGDRLDENDASYGDPDATIGFDEEDDILVVRVGDTIDIGGFAAVVASVEGESEITVRWIDVYVDLTTTPITLLERATNNEEELTV